jgi:dynein light chain 1, axonemal
MPGTSCKEAIKLWETKTGQNAAEATEVKLICQLPPIDKMDDSLNQLEACQKLSLSTNAIERMIALPKLKNLKILSLGRNNIKRIMALEDVGATLEELWISYNQIEKLDGLQPCVKLATLYIGNNKIKAWDELSKVSQLPEIKSVLFIGNPIYGEKTKEENAPFVVKRIPQISTLDGKIVTAAVRKTASEVD